MTGPPWVEIGLFLFSLLMNTIGFLIIYVFRLQISNFNSRFARNEECQKHLEQDINEFKESFEAWKVLSTEIHGHYAAAGALVTDLRADVKKLNELVPVLVYRIDALDREIHSLGDMS